MVGDMIVERIFEMPKEGNEGFGTWVTKANVEARLKRLNEDLAR